LSKTNLTYSPAFAYISDKLNHVLHAFSPPYSNRQ